jgi:hypothetical protein
MAYAFDTEAPTVDLLLCDSLSPTIDCDPVTTNQAKQSGSYITTFAFGNEPSVVRYTTDGSTPTMASPTWEAQGPRRPGQLFQYDETTTIKYFGTDIKGNVGAVQTIKLSIDDVDPTISIVEPKVAATQKVGDPGNYALGSEQIADFSCDDDDSGVISCVGTVADGAAFDTSTVGYHTFTVDAEDLAGNTASSTVTYNVVWNQYSGLLAPYSEGGLNLATAGQNASVKFRLGANYGLAILKAPLSSQRVDCATGTPIGAPAATNSETGLAWDVDKYQYDWKTLKAWAGTCRDLTIQLTDNTVHVIHFKFS